jgi:hypothetical protein
MVDLTDSLVVVAGAVSDILVGVQGTLGIQDIWYGDQDRIPRSPAVCIETGEKTRELNGAPRRTLVSLPIYLLVYHNALEAGANDQRLKNDTLAEAIETELHNHEDLGGLVVHSYCTALEPGYQRKRDALWQVTNITFVATSQVMLPYSAT